MKLLLREYIGMLKERGELDVLLPELLFSMGLQPLSKPQQGVRQYGVDVAAVGPDSDDGNTQKLFLLTIKAGNIDRADWDGLPQAVRPSLLDILQTYIPSHIAHEHRALPIKIILCCGGDLRQNIQLDWAQFTRNNSRAGQYEFKLWAGDDLSSLIERFMFNELIFDEKQRKLLRKVLALIDVNEYDLKEYIELINSQLEQLKCIDCKRMREKHIKCLKGINLILSIVFHWADDVGNLRQALLAAERTVLSCWHTLAKNDLLVDEMIRNEFLKIHESFRTIVNSYHSKLKRYSQIQDGLWGYGADEVEYQLRTFESIGILAICGLTHVYLPIGHRKSSYQKEAKIVGEDLMNIIRNNPAAFSPSMDGHSVDIGLALLLLLYVEMYQDAEWWIKELVSRILFSFQIGSYFPICTDNIDDLIDVAANVKGAKDGKADISTLIPMLAEFCAILNLKEPYANITYGCEKLLSKTTLQLWYPDATTESVLFAGNAALESGSSYVPIVLPLDIASLKARMSTLVTYLCNPEDMAFFEHGLSFYGLVASRHFRTPIMPYYWQVILKDYTQL